MTTTIDQACNTCLISKKTRVHNFARMSIIRTLRRKKIIHARIYTLLTEYKMQQSTNAMFRKLFSNKISRFSRQCKILKNHTGTVNWAKSSCGISRGKECVNPSLSSLGHVIKIAEDATIQIDDKRLPRMTGGEELRAQNILIKLSANIARHHRPQNNTRGT